MSNSPLVSYTKISPCRSSPRNHKIDTITIHCVVGQCTVESLGEVFALTERQSSSNYGVGRDGRIGMYCEEKDRSWCTSNRENDNRAITIEVASDTTHPYAVTDEAYNALIELLVDICKRNGIKKLLWKADKSLIGQPDKQNMTVHRWFANKACPGEYLYSRHGDIAEKVNAQLETVGEVEESPEEDEETAETPKQPDTIYRVQTGAFTFKQNAVNLLEKVKAAGFDAYMVKIENLYKVQVGAYTLPENAREQVRKLKDAGFNSFITSRGGDKVEVAAEEKKSVEQLAKEVWWGKWGNGEDRKNRLTAAGYDYEAVQAKVKELYYK